PEREGECRSDGRTGDLEWSARDRRRREEQPGRENETADERDDRRVHIPEERGSDGTSDRGGDATRIAPRKSERAGSEAEPDEHHAELRRAGRPGPAPKPAR